MQPSKCFFAAMGRVGDQQPARSPGGVQGVHHFAPKVSIGAILLLVPVGVIDLFQTLGECLGAAQDHEWADQRGSASTDASGHRS